MDIKPLCGELNSEVTRESLDILMAEMLLRGINLVSQEFPDLKPPELD